MLTASHLDDPHEHAVVIELVGDQESASFGRKTTRRRPWSAGETRTSRGTFSTTFHGCMSVPAWPHLARGPSWILLAPRVSSTSAARTSAASAMSDPLSQDFADGLQPDNLVTLAATHSGVSSTSYPPSVTDASTSSAPATLRDMNHDAMKKQNEPSAESVEEMPEIDDERFRRLPGRGHLVNRSLGEIVAIDPELWAYFGSAEAVNDALRRVVSERKKAAGS
jgi:hypothetical protein